MIRWGREPHSCQALVEPTVPAHAVPLWGHGEMDQGGVAAINGSSISSHGSSWAGRSADGRQVQLPALLDHEFLTRSCNPSSYMYGSRASADPDRLLAQLLANARLQYPCLLASNDARTNTRSQAVRRTFGEIVAKHPQFTPLLESTSCGNRPVRRASFTKSAQVANWQAIANSKRTPIGSGPSFLANGGRFAECVQPSTASAEAHKSLPPAGELNEAMSGHGGDAGPREGSVEFRPVKQLNRQVSYLEAAPAAWRSRLSTCHPRPRDRQRPRAVRSDTTPCHR